MQQICVIHPPIRNCVHPLSLWTHVSLCALGFRRPPVFIWDANVVSSFTHNGFHNLNCGTAISNHEMVVLGFKTIILRAEIVVSAPETGIVMHFLKLLGRISTQSFWNLKWLYWILKYVFQGI